MIGQFTKDTVLVEELHTRPAGAIFVPQPHGATFGTIPLSLIHNGPMKHKHVVAWSPHDPIECTFVLNRTSVPPSYEKHPSGAVLVTRLNTVAY